MHNDGFLHRSRAIPQRRCLDGEATRSVPAVGALAQSSETYRLELLRVTRRAWAIGAGDIR